MPGSYQQSEFLTAKDYVKRRTRRIGRDLKGNGYDSFSLVVLDNHNKPWGVVAAAFL
jgi:hypothetical protein